MTGRKTSTRIGDAERVGAQHALQEHLNAGRLQVNEYADRCASAANATTASELAALFEDLPAPRPKLPGMSDSALGAILRNRVLVAAAVLVLAGLALVIGLSGRSDPLPPPWTAAEPARVRGTFRLGKDLGRSPNLDPRPVLLISGHRYRTIVS